MKLLSFNFFKCWGLMVARKVTRLAIRLVSMAGTGFEYVTMKNPKNTTWKLRLVKYDPIVRKRVLFKVRFFFLFFLL